MRCVRGLYRVLYWPFSPTIRFFQGGGFGVARNIFSVHSNKSVGRSVVLYRA